MTIVVAVLFVTSVWVFLAAVLGGCGRVRDAGRDADNVLTGEVWLWERGARGVRRRAAPGDGTIRPRATAGRPAGAALRSPTA